MDRVGRSIDKIGGQDDVRRIQRVGRALTETARTTDRDTRRMARSWRTATRSIEKDISKQILLIETLHDRIQALGRERATAEVNVSGVAESQAELSALNRRLSAYGRRDVTATVNTRSRMPAPLPRGGGGPPGRGLLDFGMSGIRPRNALIGAAVGYAPALLGGAGALLGSAGSAALGAGAVGLAGGGALGAGVLGGMLIGKPAIKQIGVAQKAMQAYTDAVKDYGRESTQARTKARELSQAMTLAPRGTRQLLEDTRTLKKEWMRDTAPGRDSFMQMLVGGVRSLRRLEPVGARGANRVSRALSREGRAFANFASGRFGRQFITQGSGMFDENLGNVRGAVQSTAQTAVNIMQASRPYLREATAFLRHWTRGWATSTNDIEKTRRRIGGMVSQLRSWWRLTRNTGGLLRSLLGSGAPEGQRAVDKLAQQMKDWQVWVQRNPRQVRAFFRDSINSSIDLAKALGRVAEAVFRITKDLGPLVDRFTQLTSLAGSLGLLTPGVGALAYGAFKGGSLLQTRRGGGGGSAGGGGILGGVAAAGGLRGVAAGARGIPGYLSGTYGIARGFGYGRTAAAGAAGLGALSGVGKVGMLAARGAGKAFLPVAALMAALDFSSFHGSVGGKVQNALSGATLGIIPRPLSDEQRQDRGLKQAQKFTSGLNQGMGRADQRSAIAALQRRIDENRRTANRAGQVVQLAGMGGGSTRRVGQASEGEKKELESQNKELRAALKERVDLYRQYVKERNRQLDAASRTRAQGLFDELQQGFRRGTKRDGIAEGFKSTVSRTLDQLGRMRKAGARSLAQTTLDWAAEQKRKNPQLTAQYDKLVEGIVRRFKGLRGQVRVVQGQILDGSTKQWGQISDSISSAMRRGVKETSAEFQRLKKIALGALQEMGYSKSDAAAIFGNRSLRSRAGDRTGAGQLSLQSDANKARSFGMRNPLGGTGDGPGQDRPSGGMRGQRGSAMAAARTRAPAAGGSPGLMGAKPALGGYASIGRSMGLQVTSGLRPGAITSSGNTSFHASGDAIDMSGSKSAMMRFAKYMASHYGSQLEELIYTPFGRGQIKNGQHFVYTGAVAADHFDHVHVADTAPAQGAGRGGVPGGGAAGGGAQQINLRARRSRLGGIPGALSGRAMGGLALGIEKAINSRLAQFGAPGGGSPGPGRGGKYNASSLASLWVAAGGPPSVARLMGAIAMAESGGAVRAHNPSGASGLWQILGVPFPGNPMDAMTNARMAVAKYRTQGLRAWEAYTNGAYRRYAGDGLGRDLRRPFKRPPARTGDGLGRAARVTARPQTRPAGIAAFTAARPASRPQGRVTAGGHSVAVDFNGAVFHVREEADIKKVAEHVGEKILEVLSTDRIPDEAIA